MRAPRPSRSFRRPASATRSSRHPPVRPGPASRAGRIPRHVPSFSPMPLSATVSRIPASDDEQFDRDGARVRVFTNVRERLLRGTQQHHVGGHALRRQVVGDARGDRDAGLGREPVALPLNCGGQRPLAQGLGVSSATIARASARFSRAVARISSTCRFAAAVSDSSSGSTACASMTMLVNPCASVSWISRASRSRSAAVPASRDKRALSARVAASSATNCGQLSALSHRRDDHGADHRGDDDPDEREGDGHD